VINLAGRSVSCRYTPANLQAMMDSRVNSARVVGEAIAAAQPPRVWLQMSTATVYAHRFDAPNDEATGVIGGRNGRRKKPTHPAPAKSPCAPPW
jgi:NAD dependent epimerase/dehydratase family enzyme